MDEQEKLELYHLYNLYEEMRFEYSFYQGCLNALRELAHETMIRRFPTSDFALLGRIDALEDENVLYLLIMYKEYVMAIADLATILDDAKDAQRGFSEHLYAIESSRHEKRGGTRAWQLT